MLTQVHYFSQPHRQLSQKYSSYLCFSMLTSCFACAYSISDEWWLMKLIKPNLWFFPSSHCTSSREVMYMHKNFWHSHQTDVFPSHTNIHRIFLWHFFLIFSCLPMCMPEKCSPPKMLFTNQLRRQALFISSRNADQISAII